MDLKNGSILTFHSGFSPLKLIRYPAHYIIHAATWSNMEHIATYFDGNIDEAKFPKYQSTPIFDRLLKEGAAVYVREPLFKIDEEKWLEARSFLMDKKYDVDGAIYSAIDKIAIYKKNPNDNEFFCSESIAYYLQTQKVLSMISNRNKWSPIEIDRYVAKVPLYSDAKILWKNKRLAYVK